MPQRQKTQSRTKLVIPTVYIFVTLLDKALGPEGYYGVFTANMHTDSASSSGSEAIVASALARGVPVVSARQMLAWLDGRNNSSFGSVTWSGSTVNFTITVEAGGGGLMAMLPANSAIGPLTGISQNGNPVAFSAAVIKGIQYAIFPATAGEYQAAYAAP